MINDLDESLRQLLIEDAGLDPSVVDISFDIPTRDWAAGSAAIRPTVNLYLFDIRENRELRETGFDAETTQDGRMRVRRLPLRVDVSYMVTCWTSMPEDQHRLLWQVLETLFRHSPLPDRVLQGRLRDVPHPVRTEIAAPDGILKNVSDFWGALDNQLRPAIHLVVTLDLDLAQIRTEPLVFAELLRYGQSVAGPDGRPMLAPDWQSSTLRWGGQVRSPAGEPVAGAAVRLIATADGAGPRQVGPTVHTDTAGHYRFNGIPSGTYTLVVETSGQAPQQERVTIGAAERGQALSEFRHDVTVPATS